MVSYIPASIKRIRVGWNELAQCQGTDLSIWFPRRESSQVHADASRICERCPLRRECLDLVMRMERGKDANRRHGVYAGTTPSQRQALEQASRG
jgi:hypothetical protein